MKILLILLFIVAVALPIANGTVFVGQTFANVTLNATASNTAINMSGMSTFAGRLEVANNSISLQNVSYNVSGANFSFPGINFTTANSLIYSYQFPNISLSSGNTIVILNGLPQNVSNVTIVVGTNGITPWNPLLTFPDLSTQIPAYVFDNTTGLMTFTVGSLPSGSTTLQLNDGACGVAGNAACGPGSYQGGGGSSGGASNASLNGSPSTIPNASSVSLNFSSAPFGFDTPATNPLVIGVGVLACVGIVAFLFTRSL